MKRQLVRAPPSQDQSEVRQASLVALYGRKPAVLGDFLTLCQDRIGAAMQRHGISGKFCPYSLPQMHATVVGLERRSQDGLENRNLHAFRGLSRVMHLPAFFEFILACNHLPFHVQIGGFQDREYRFQSRGGRPYHRSFSLEGRTAVVIGWPVRTAGCATARSSGETAARHGEVQDYPNNLEDLRRSAQRFNVLHRWHRQSADVDNDLYIRLGLFESEPPDRQRGLIEDEIRRGLSTSLPLILELTVADLAVVSYPADDQTLPETRSEAFPLTDPRLRDEHFIAGLYG